MPDIDKGNESIIFIIPDHSDIHINAELIKVIGSLDSLCSQRRMKRVFGKYGKLGFELFFLGFGQFFIVFLKLAHACCILCTAP